MIDQVQGFVSQTAALVDTTPTVGKDVAIDLVKKRWNHTLDSSRLAFDLKESELQILRSVRNLENSFS